MNRPPALLFGVPVADLTMGEALDLIGQLVDEGRRDGTTHQIATVNLDFLVNALTQPAVKTILQQADVCLADGMPVVWAGRLLGMPIRERVAGSDLVPLLAEASSSRGWRVHIFGSSPQVAERADTLLTSRYPNARISIDPGPMFDDVESIDGDVLDAIANVDADILCVALGNPKQEQFISAHRDRLGTPVMIGVGGSLDMLVGYRKRAPTWMQRTGLEWIARAVQEPRRLGPRYAHDIRVFGPRFAREWRAVRRRRSHRSIEIDASSEVVSIRFAASPTTDDTTWYDAAGCIDRGAALVCDGADGNPISDRAAARLIGLVRLGRRAQHPVVWRGASGDLRRSLDSMGVTAELVEMPGK